MRQSPLNNWIVPAVPDLSGLQKQTGLSYLLTRLLYLRGRTSPREMEDFLYPQQARALDPFLLADMDRAVQRIGEAIAAGEKIRIIGDYDQDGIASTAIIVLCLKQLGARVDYRIPDRITEGYGIKPGHVQEAKEDEIHLLLTCDNGVSAFEAAQAAAEQGIDLLITDHHQPPETLPPAIAIINPNRPDCPYPNKFLAGAGVSLKLCEALWKKLGSGEFPEILYGFAAMGTVCDIMTLMGENRNLVLRGLKALNTQLPPGLHALKEESGIRGILDVYTLGFLIGPAMNAAGRLDTADKGVQLLLTTDPLEAVRLARQLRQLNRTRQEMTETALEKALELVPDPLPHLLILETDCHESLLGIVAGKLRDKYHRPAYLLTTSQDPSVLKASARSISSYNMIERLTAAGDHLLQFGGHAMAAGFSVERNKLDDIRAALLAGWDPSEQDLQKTLRIDYPVDLAYVNANLAQELERLEPYGKGNPKPLFASRDVQLAGVKVIGKNKNTLRYRFRRGNQEFKGIQFRNAEETLKKLYTRFGRRLEDAFAEQGEDLRVSIVYTPQMNEYGGARFLQLQVEDIR